MNDTLSKILIALAGLAVAVTVVVVAVLAATRPTTPEFEYTPVPAPPTTDLTVWTCQNEDGSGQEPGQFPCVWLGGANGQGAHLLYLGPDSKPIEVRL